MIDVAKYKFILIVLLLVIVALAFYLLVFRAKRQPLLRIKRPQFAVPVEAIKKVTLKNGMTVLVFKNTMAPKVLVQIAYNIGSFVEDSHERGLAHLIEHMIFKGTKKLAEGDIDAIARKYGASYNAFTAMDITSYYFEANKNNWKPFLDILADCMQNARFDSQHLASEIKAVIQEIKMNKDDYWRNMFFKALELSFPANHPYHFPVIGFKDELLTLSAENLKNFYNKYYHPENAVLFVVGDVDIDDVVTVAQTAFENIPAQGQAQLQPFPAIIPEMVTHNTRFYEDVQKEQLGFYWLIPGQKDKNETTASLLEFILGAGEGSRLYKVLVDEKKLANSLSVKASKFMEAGLFFIFVEPVTGKSNECKKVVEQELLKIINQGVSEYELDRVIRIKSRRFFERLQSLSSFTYNWIKTYFSTKDEFEIFKRVDKYARVAADDVKLYAKTYLDPFLMNVIQVLPLPAEKHAFVEHTKKMTDELDQLILSRHVRTAVLEQPVYVHQIGEPHDLEFSFPKPDRVITLSNGLTVLLHKRGTLPLISCDCQFVDADYLSVSQDGVLTGVMMDMLMEGSKNFSKADNVNYFESRGVRYHFDNTGAGVAMINDDYEDILKRFMHVLTMPAFPKEALNKIKDITVDNYERCKDSPMSMTERALKKILYKEQNYGWSFDEAITWVKKINQVDLFKLHMQFVTPSNMIFAVVGNFDLNVMESVIKRIFEPWPAGAAKKIDYPKVKFTPKEHVDTFMLRDQAVLILGQPSPLSVYDPDLVSMKILNIIAFKSLGSRLYQLREETGMFYAAFGNFATAASREPGFDYVGAILSVDKLEMAEQRIRLLLKNLAINGITEQELAAARQIYLKALIDGASTISAIAGTLTYLQGLNLGFDYYDNVLKQVQTMTKESLNKAAAQYLAGENMARIRIGRIETAKKSVDQKEVANV